MSRLDLHRVFQGAIISEKSHLASKEKNRVYVFRVHYLATKTLIKNLLESTFDVKVASIRTCLYKSETQSKRRRHRRAPFVLNLSKYKKAYISLKKGELPDAIQVAQNQKQENQEAQDMIQKLDSKRLQNQKNEKAVEQNKSSSSKQTEDQEG
jgi:large subunit ribosomal protein L23